jgi:hypothetical protein
VWFANQAGLEATLPAYTVHPPLAGLHQKLPSPRNATSAASSQSLDLSCWEVANPSTGDNDNDRDERGLIKLPPSVFHSQIP